MPFLVAIAVVSLLVSYLYLNLAGSDLITCRRSLWGFLLNGKVF